MVKWSYSSMSLFQQCPKKFYHIKVAKTIVEPTSWQMIYGLEAHKVAEDYVQDDVPIPEKFAFMKGALDTVKKYKGVIYCEHKMGVTDTQEACDFNADNVWWRGIADLLVVQGDRAKIIDYKTGQNKYADTKQLELLALAAFKHFPELKVINAGLLFVVHPAFIKQRYERDEIEHRWGKWKEKAEELGTAYTTNVWNPKQNFTCRSWCPVVNCAHNGKR